MQIRADVKRAVTDVLAADSWLDAIPKVVVMLLAFAGWKIVWITQITGQMHQSWTTLVLNGFAESLPFALLSYYAIIKQIQILKKLSLRSRKDPLTGLNNRQTFLENATARLSEQPRGVLLLIDADFFKNVNDTYGHAVGDRCIAAIGHRLQWHIRENDVAGRLGGEEFAILLPCLTVQQAISIAARVGMPISFTDGNNETELSITLSIGLVDTRESETLHDLLIMADDALYDAKRAGRATLAQWSGGSTEVIKTLSMKGPITGRERRKSPTVKLEKHAGAVKNAV